MYRKIERCRVCGNENLVPLLSLGVQTLTGVFPKTKDEKITSGPLELVKCMPGNEEAADCCGLVQLHHSYDHKEMYGLNYGYRSGLNSSMVQHLKSIVETIKKKVTLQPGDLIIDIGSNDGTLLSNYSSTGNYILAGIDPTSIKFKKYYPIHVAIIPDFFSASLVKKHFPGKKAKVITSIAMFYDLERPMEFVKDIFEALDDDGVWVFEQSYLSTMILTTSYDTICHEHSEYYGLKQVKWMLDKMGMKILDVELNNINGGSFQVMAAKSNSIHRPNKAIIDALVLEEEEMQLDTLEAYKDFAENIEKHKINLIEAINQINGRGEKVFGYGASTKGNVMLQYCGFTSKDIPYIAEVNEEKFGCFTPATFIPIISEKEARAMKPDYFLILPWHFRKSILHREKDFVASGGKFLFPLPEIEVVAAEGIKRSYILD